MQSAKQIAIEFSVKDLYKISTLSVPLGISYISSSLKKIGHTTEILYCTPFTYKKGITNYIEQEPQVFTVTITSLVDLPLAIDLIKTLRLFYKKSKIVVGGAYVTISPEQILHEIKEIDAICIGAGEKAIVEYVKQVEKGEYTKTDNLWIKTGKEVIKCDKSLSIENLDDLPYPDRDGWERWLYHSDKNKTNWEKWLSDSDNIKVVLMSRGCIYNCVFCSNKELRKISHNRYFNVRSIKSIIDEIDYIVKKYKKIKGIILEGENALADLDRFKDLCLALKDYNNKLKQKLEFSVNINFTSNLLNKDIDVIFLMKEANFKFIRFSLESGSFEIRKILNKPVYNNEEFITFCDKMHKANIDIMIYAMYCFPFETKETYHQTLDCLRACKPEHFKYTWLQLYDRTVNKKITFADLYRFFTLKFRVYIKYTNIFRTVALALSIDTMFDRISEVKKFKFVRVTDDKYELLAKQELDKGNYKQAIKYFNKVAIKDDNAWIYGDRAIAKMNAGDYNGAIKDFDEVLKLDPKEIYKQKKQECLNLLNS